MDTLNHLWEKIVRGLECATGQLLLAAGQDHDRVDAIMCARSASIQQLVLHSISFRTLDKGAQEHFLDRAMKTLEEGEAAVRKLAGDKQEAVRDCSRGQNLRTALIQQSGAVDPTALALAG